MKVILKPMGAVLLGTMIVGLGALALGAGKGGAAPSARPLSVYGDTEANGWEVKKWTWAKNVDFANREVVHTGNAAIRVRFQNFDGVKFHSEKPGWAGYDRILFYIHGGKEGGQSVRVGGTLTPALAKAGSPATERPLRDVTLKPLPPGRWCAVVIPVRDLLPPGSHAEEIDSWWISGARGDMQAAVYLDDVQLLPPGSPAPSETPLGLDTVK